MRFFENLKRLIKTSTKPDRKYYWLSVKICFVGITILGIIAFLIRLLALPLLGRVP